MKKMKKIKKIILLTLAFVLLLTSSITVFSSDDMSDYLSDEEKLVLELREALVNREEAFTIKWTQKGELGGNFLDPWLEQAFEETGVSNEGDYLRWHVGPGNVSGSGMVYPDGTHYYTLNFTFAYHTTLEQEMAVEAEVDRILEELDLATYAPDYEKAKAVYDYLCDNVVYDYDNLADDSYKLKHSAYAAAIDKKAVCQGYANLLYRMLRELGINTRMVSGASDDGEHMWNIVELEGMYYNLDATWDAIRQNYEYFLKGSANFPEHYSDAEYLTEEFTTAYPISESDYVYVEKEEVPGDANGDQKVNSKDMLLLRRFLAGGYNVEINEEACDVNNDSKVNSKDMLLLRRYLAGGYGVILQ